MGPSNKSVRLFKNKCCDIFSKTVLQVKICENNKISDMFLVSWMRIFQNTSMLSINAARMNMVALKMYF